MRTRGIVAMLLLGALAVSCTPATTGSSAKDKGEVVVYTSVDQVFAEPIFKDFEARTGVRVRPVYDAEAAKTTGLVNRLVAEKSRPRADVWWSGEIVQTLKLAHDGLLAPYRSPSAKDIPSDLRDPSGLWTGMGGRARVLIVSLAAKGTVPTSLADLWNPAAGTDPRRTAMSDPVFGTASTQAAVLYSLWGREKAKAYYAAIPLSGMRVLEGNGDVRDKVVSGELDWGLADTDDALGAIKNGAHVRIVVPDQGAGGLGGAILIPNTVGLVAGGPDPATGRLLIDYLLSARTERRLVDEQWIQFPVRGAPDRRVSAAKVRFLSVDWKKAYDQLDASAADMREIFLK